MLYDNPKCLVLSAEDDLDDQMFMQEAFAELGLNCELMLFPDGKKLVEYLEKGFREIYDSGLPCMIFLDLNMPQLSGKEVLELLRNHIGYYAIPIFILSTNTSEQDVQACYALGANAVLQKPVEFSSYKKMLLGIYKHWMPFLFLPEASMESHKHSHFSALLS